MIPAIAFAIVLTVTILIIKIIKKKNEEAKALLKAKQEQERQAYLDKINKIKSNETVKSWANEIYYYISATISSKAYLDHTFHLLPYKQDFEFGINLQNIYLEYTGKMLPQKNRKSIFVYNFAKNELPELKNDAEMLMFTTAVAEMIEEKLKEYNITVTLKKIRIFTDQHGYNVSDMEGEMIAIVYKHPTSNAQW